MNSKKNSCRGNYMRKYGIYCINFFIKCTFFIYLIFLQDDLAHDDIMILDTGDQVFLWMGPRCSEVEVKLSYKSAQVYIQNLRAKQPEKTRKLFLTIMGKESKRFTRCFHGWTSPSLKSVPK